MTTAFASDIDWSNFNSSVIIEVTRPTGVFTSTGVAISRELILTAAHCLEGEILGVKIFNQASYQPKATFFKINNFKIHPLYNKNKSNYKHDLAKIYLKDLLPESTNFYPIARDLKQLNGKILRLGFGSRSKQNNRTLTNPELKAVTPLENILELEDHHSYSGDSGGPIFVQKNGQMFLIAIHSTLSYGPQGRFSYNPLLTSEREWIFDN